MKQNIVEIQVPAGLSEAPEDAQGGVMYEHNATALRFCLTRFISRRNTDIIWSLSP